MGERILDRPSKDPRSKDFCIHVSFLFLVSKTTMDTAFNSKNRLGNCLRDLLQVADALAAAEEEMDDVALPPAAPAAGAAVPAPPPPEDKNKIESALRMYDSMIRMPKGVFLVERHKYNLAALHLEIDKLIAEETEMVVRAETENKPKIRTFRDAVKYAKMYHVHHSRMQSLAKLKADMVTRAALDAIYIAPNSTNVRILENYLVQIVKAVREMNTSTDVMHYVAGSLASPLSSFVPHAPEPGYA